MKRYVFIIGLWVACFALPNTLQAQWSYTRTAMAIGSGDISCTIEKKVVNNIEPVSPSFPSYEECEANRTKFENYYSRLECYRIVCGPCTGRGSFSDGFGNSSGGFGNTNITATNQGDPFHSDNPYEALPNAYEQKNLQNEKLLGKGDIGSVKYAGNEIALTGDANFDTKYANLYFKKPRIFEQPLEPISSQEHAEDKYKKQMEEAKRELAECKNDLCRMMAEKKYNDAFNMLASMSQNKAEQTLSDLMRKEYEKKLEASNNKPEEKYDWGNVLIDYGELGLSVTAASIPKLATGAGAFLATANISLWAELARVVNNQDEYIDWTGKHTRTYLGIIEIDWYGPCKIASNVLTAVTASLVGGKVASKVTNAMPISGKQINGIYRSNRATEVEKVVEKVNNTYNNIEAVQIGLRAADIPPNNKQ